MVAGLGPGLRVGFELPGATFQIKKLVSHKEEIIARKAKKAVEPRAVQNKSLSFAANGNIIRAKMY